MQTFPSVCLCKPLACSLQRVNTGLHARLDFFFGEEQSGFKGEPASGLCKADRRMLHGAELIFRVVVELLDKRPCKADSEETEITETGEGFGLHFRSNEYVFKSVTVRSGRAIKSNCCQSSSVGFHQGGRERGGGRIYSVPR